MVRVGLGRDTDLGLMVLPLGAGANVRYRFLESGRWHAAVVPGMNAYVQPNESITIAVDVQAPLVVEYVFHPAWSVAVDARLNGRTDFTPVSHGPDPYNGTLVRFAAMPELGTRLEHQGPRFRFGMSVSAVFQPSRGGSPGVAASIDFGGRIGRIKKPEDR